MTGRSLEKRAKILGLADVTTTERYSRLRPDHFTEEHSKPVHWREPVVSGNSSPLVMQGHRKFELPFHIAASHPRVSDDGSYVNLAAAGPYARLHRLRARLP